MSARIPLAVLVAALAVPSLGAEETGSVTLPLADYHRLVDAVREAEDARRRALEAVEPAVLQVTSQHTRVSVADGRAEIATTFEIEVRGMPERTLPLPVAGTPWRARLEPEGLGSLGRTGGGLELVPGEPGVGRVTVEAVATPSYDGGVARIELPPAAAPVSTTELDLPADLAWSCPGAAVADDAVEGDRRRVRLALARGRAHQVELRREVSGGEAERALARAVVVTLVKLKPDGPTRHDMVLYEVARGALDRLVIGLPEGLEPDAVITDEGDAPPDAPDGSLHLTRRTLLRGTSGFVSIRSRLGPEGVVPLAPVRPEVQVRSRYLALSSRVAAEVEPQPPERWTRVDLGDLPGPVLESADGLDLVAAWRWSGDDAPARLALRRSPAAPLLPQVVRDRSTTTLLTVEGTLLHRDRLSVAGQAATFELRLPADATLWSVTVDGLAVRPHQRDGATLVPLPFGPDREAVVEVVSVQQRAFPPGRSRARLTSPEVSVPVLRHLWRLLLPEGDRYRWADGDLRPAPLTAAVVAAAVPVPEAAPTQIPERTSVLMGQAAYEGQPLPGVSVTVTGMALQGTRTAVTAVNGGYLFRLLPPGTYTVRFELDGFRTFEVSGVRLRPGQAAEVHAEMFVESVAEEITVTADAPTLSGRTASATADRREREIAQAAAQSRARQELANLGQGLVGGVRPIPVTIPESGKILFMAGALPPPTVAVELEVKAAQER